MPSTRTPKAIAEWLGTVPFLQKCPRQELALVDRHTTVVTVPAGTSLCREGQVGREAFIIVNGEAEVVVGDVTVAHLKDGSLCGEMALLEHGVRSATVTAVTPMTLLAMSHGEFKTVLAEAPCVSRHLLETLSGRLRRADEALGAR